MKIPRIHGEGWKRYSLERGLPTVPVVDSVLLSWKRLDSGFLRTVFPARSTAPRWSSSGIFAVYCCSRPSYSAVKTATWAVEGWSLWSCAVYCRPSRHGPAFPMNHVCLQNRRFCATINFHQSVIKSYLRGITESVLMSSEMIIESIRGRKIDKLGKWLMISRKQGKKVRMALL